MKTINATRKHSFEEIEETLKGKLLWPDAYDMLITEDCDVFDRDTGKCILKFRKWIIPKSVSATAFNNLRTAAQPSMNRATASKENQKERRVKLDWTLSKTSEADPVNSGIVGYFDRYARTPYCRQTAFTMKHIEKFRKAYPIIKCVDTLYATLMPDNYKAQREKAESTNPDFVITDTAFTTITVNSNWQTAVHTDSWDFLGWFGNLTVIRAGEYSGGYFCLPEWRIWVDMQTGDILLVDVHSWHGNTPIKGIKGSFERLSLVMYYRDNMIECWTMAEELERAKRLWPNSKITW